MARKSFATRVGQLAATTLTLLLAAAGAQSKSKTIYTFDLTHGAYPVSGLVSDGAGNLYGTANTGGLYPTRRNPCCGTVFEFSPGTGGTWSEMTIYAFKGLSDGSNPYGTMVFRQGNLYGTASIIGFSTVSTIFELTKGSNGTWSEKTIYTFTGSEGLANGDLSLDSEGNLYGTTQSTFSSAGEVFELSPQSNGTWKETIPFAFTPSFPLGDPRAGVTFDCKGNLYGTTDGSATGYGGVYELSPQSNGTWKATALFTFPGGNAGGNPDGKLIFDANDNLYGVTSGNNQGVVFELSPGSNGTWTETVLHVFPAGVTSDGAHPQGSLVLDANGNLYGTAPAGGLGCNNASCGVVYELSPQSGGTWKETILHQFEAASDGSQPQAGLALDSAGNLFGTTKFGGSRYGYGTAFEITP